MYRFLIPILFIFCLSCGKEEGADAVYKLSTMLKSSSSAEAIYTDSVVGYCFYVDTTDYEVVDYAAALSGKVSNKHTSSQVDYAIEATYDHNLNALVFDGVSQETVMFVVCDTTNNIYSYRKATIGYQIDTIYVVLNIQTYSFEDNEDAVVKVNSWTQQK